LVKDQENLLLFSGREDIINGLNIFSKRAGDERIVKRHSLDKSKIGWQSVGLILELESQNRATVVVFEVRNADTVVPGLVIAEKIDRI
jgi:hypothetical protein